MAEELGADPIRRAALCLIEAFVVFYVVTMWGHPEDLVALAAAVYALLAMFRHRWSLAAWLWGAAIVVQPLVLLMAPLAFVRTPRTQRLRVWCIAAAPAAVLVGTPLLVQWGSTSKVLLQQPNFPYLDQATPWVALAPHLSRLSVGAGPGRLLAIVGSLALAVMAARRCPSPVGLLWLCALALSLRCVFEAVMVPFYLGPPLALILVAASLRNSWPRLVGASTVSVVATVMAFHRWSEWAYWTPMVVLLAVALGLAWPGLRALGLSRWDEAGPDRAEEPGGRDRFVMDVPLRSGVPREQGLPLQRAGSSPTRSRCVPRPPAPSGRTYASERPGGVLPPR